MSTSEAQPHYKLHTFKILLNKHHRCSYVGRTAALRNKVKLTESKLLLLGFSEWHELSHIQGITHKSIHDFCPPSIFWQTAFLFKCLRSCLSFYVQNLEPDCFQVYTKSKAVWGMSTRGHSVSTEQGNARGAKQKAEHQQPQQERGRNRGLPESGLSERGLENVIQNRVVAPASLGLHTGAQEPAGALHDRRYCSQASSAPHQQHW